MDASTGCVAPAFARHPYFEPFVATASFALWVNLFRVIECGGVAAALASIFDVRKGTHVMRAGAAYAAGIALLLRVVPKADIDFRCPSASALVGEVAYGLVLYDAVFFVLHRAMHESLWLNRLLGHRHHHRSAGERRRVRASDVLDHSLVDGTLQVLANVLVQRYGPLGGPKNFLSRLVHNVVVTYLLTDSHADTPYRLSRLFPRLLKGANDHHAHHRHSGPPYQQFFGYFDALFAPPDKKKKGAKS